VVMCECQGMAIVKVTCAPWLLAGQLLSALWLVTKICRCHNKYGSIGCWCVSKEACWCYLIA
jgi:hypothetical protein